MTWTRKETTKKKTTKLASWRVTTVATSFVSAVQNTKEFWKIQVAAEQVFFASFSAYASLIYL